MEGGGGSLPSPLVPHAVLFCFAPSLKASRQVSGVGGMLLEKKKQKPNVLT